MNNHQYKIVYCAPAIYSAGGVERVVSVKSSYFAEVYGYDVAIIVTEGYGKDCFFSISPKVHIVNLNLGFEELWRASFIKKVFLYLQKQRKYKKLLTQELIRIRPDITISVLRREINFINSIQDGSKKIGELHVNRSNYRNFTTKDSNLFKQIFAGLWTRDLIRHLRDLDRMVVLTDSAKNDWLELSNVIKIPDPLPFKIDDTSKQSSKRIISIGRYAYEKGNDLLLEAWSKVEKECEDWCLDIYGMGDRQPYFHLMNELGIDQQRCHLNGSLLDVKTEYLKSSLFVLPSRFEGFGLVIIEAMACGLPVISFDCENGPRNIITHEHDGILVKAFDVEEYALQIIRLIKDADLRKTIGEAAQKTSRHFDIDKVAEQWRKLFDEVMAEK
jgi:glycosyltransferase involved in cell wall biosynthesis